MSEAIVEVIDMVKHYGTVKAVDGVSFTVHRGEVFSLVGPNGAGKTTTVEVLECLRTPTSGTVHVLGLDVTKRADEIKQRIGVMPQNFQAFDRLTVKEHIQLIQRIYGIKTDMKGILDDFSLWDVHTRQLGKLSGGQRRRVGIAMAVASDPEMLFLDEPTTGLDPQGRRETWEVIQRLKKMGKTVIVTTHYMEEVEKLADRAAVILDGKIIANDTIKNLIARYGGGIKLSVKKVPGGEGEELLKKFVVDDAIVPDEFGNLIATFDSRYSVAEALVALYQQDEERRVEVIEPDMDEVFMRLVGGKIDSRGELI